MIGSNVLVGCSGQTFGADVLGKERVRGCVSFLVRWFIHTSRSAPNPSDFRLCQSSGHGVECCRMYAIHEMHQDTTIYAVHDMLYNPPVERRSWLCSFLRVRAPNF